MTLEFYPERVGAVFQFEDLVDDLPRPPLAALRFFRHAGVKLGLRAWLNLPTDVRWAITAEGARDEINEDVVQALLRHVAPREMKLIGALDYNETLPVSGLLEGLGLGDRWGKQGWPALRTFERFVLNHLAHNQRLLWRAFEEISGLAASPASEWSGLVAHAEVQIRATTDLVPGTVELDWRVREPQSMVLWQAHVSTHIGEFFPAAALLAATTAAVCLYDMIKEFDPEASVQHACLVEEAWEVGKFAWDAVTRLFDAPG